MINLMIYVIVYLLIGCFYALKTSKMISTKETEYVELGKKYGISERQMRNKLTLSVFYSIFIWPFMLFLGIVLVLRKEN